MDTSPIPGFITRRQASERCRRAERTLQRYWSRAIELRDDQVLRHLKLRAEDGRTIEGADVTKDLIEQLKRSRQNPTWYVHATWVEETYGPRDEEAASRRPTPAPDSPAQSLPAGSPADVAGILREQLQKKDEEINYLRSELGIKNEQIREANERTRESNVLMRDLQQMLGDWQQQAFRALPAGRSEEQPTAADAGDAAEVGTAPQEIAEAGSARTRRASARARPGKSVRRTKSANARDARQPGLFEKHTPTFHKALSGLFRRP